MACRTEAETAVPRPGRCRPRSIGPVRPPRERDRPSLLWSVPDPRSGRCSPPGGNPVDGRRPPRRRRARPGLGTGCRCDRDCDFARRATLAAAASAARSDRAGCPQSDQLNRTNWMGRIDWMDRFDRRDRGGGPASRPVRPRSADHRSWTIRTSVPSLMTRVPRARPGAGRLRAAPAARRRAQSIDGFAAPVVRSARRRGRRRS